MLTIFEEIWGQSFRFSLNAMLPALIVMGLKQVLNLPGELMGYCLLWVIFPAILLAMYLDIDAPLALSTWNTYEYIIGYLHESK